MTTRRRLDAIERDVRELRSKVEALSAPPVAPVRPSSVPSLPPSRSLVDVEISLSEILLRGFLTGLGILFFGPVVIEVLADALTAVSSWLRTLGPVRGWYAS